MTLGEFIKSYRHEHGLSKRAFAIQTGVSVQQISNIENGVGNNGKPMTSTMKTYKKIADGIGMSEVDFLSLLNDNVLVNPSSVNPSELTADETALLDAYRELSDQGKQYVLQTVDLARRVYMKSGDCTPDVDAIRGA